MLTSLAICSSSVTTASGSGAVSSWYESPLPLRLGAPHTARRKARATSEHRPHCWRPLPLLPPPPGPESSLAAPPRLPACSSTTTCTLTSSPLWLCLHRCSTSSCSCFCFLGALTAVAGTSTSLLPSHSSHRPRAHRVFSFFPNITRHFLSRTLTPRSNK